MKTYPALMFSLPITGAGSGGCREGDAVWVSVSVGQQRLWDGWFGVPGVPHKTPSWGGTGPPGWGTHLRRSSLPSKPWEPGPIPGAGEGAVDAAGTPQPQGPLRAAVARLICWKLVFFQGCAVPVNESGAAVLWAM